MKLAGTYSASRVSTFAFTLVEIMIAIAIFSLVLAAIYSSWTAILRASKTGLEAAAAVQRSRIAVRVLEDSLTSAQSYVANQSLYGFMAQNGDDPQLSFVARLAPSFPRSGKFGDLTMRRVTFSVERAPDGSRQLVLRQIPLVMDIDVDEKEHPIVLARHVREFSFQLWDNRLNDWVDEWKQTNQLPKLLMFTLRTGDNAFAATAQEEVSRIVSLPAVAVQPIWQVPRMLPGPGGFPGPGGLQPGVVPPGGVANPNMPITQPGVVPSPGVTPGVLPPR